MGRPFTEAEIKQLSPEQLEARRKRLEYNHRYYREYRKRKRLEKQNRDESEQMIVRFSSASASLQKLVRDWVQAEQRAKQIRARLKNLL